MRKKSIGYYQEANKKVTEIKFLSCITKHKVLFDLELFQLQSLAVMLIMEFKIHRLAN